MAETTDTETAPEVATYQIGERTMKRVFEASGIENVADLQAVFDAVEAALAKMDRVKPYSPYVDGKFVP